MYTVTVHMLVLQTQMEFFPMYDMDHVKFLPAKLTGPQPVKKFPTFCGTQRFITAFTRARHESLSKARSIQSTSPTHVLKIHFNIILPSMRRPSK